ncbi:MAG: hypothetical protein Q8O51_01390 [bacterium]|nr:hypothetical protein [bacterium]
MFFQRKEDPVKRILTIAAVLLAMVLVGCQDTANNAIVGVNLDATGIHYDAATGKVLINGNPAEPAQIAHWLIAEKPEVSGLKELELLPDSIHLQILKAGMVELGVNQDTAQQVVSAISLDDSKRASITAAAGSCQQVIEYEPCAGGTSAWRFWVDWYCDGDPKDAEYVFQYYPSWSDSPDDVRWYTYNAWVYYAFLISYRANLLSIDACSPGIYLCIGDKGVYLAGSPYLVSTSVLIAHR